MNLGTHLTGAEEVPARDTPAQGQAIFRVSDDGMSVEYKLIVANIENAFMAHIHMAPAGSNGRIVVWLYPSTAVAPGPVGQGRIEGVIAQGTFRSANRRRGAGGTSALGPIRGHPGGKRIRQRPHGRRCCPCEHWRRRFPWARSVGNSITVVDGGLDAVSGEVVRKDTSGWREGRQPDVVVVRASESPLVRPILVATAAGEATLTRISRR